MAWNLSSVSIEYEDKGSGWLVESTSSVNWSVGLPANDTRLQNTSIMDLDIFLLYALGPPRLNLGVVIPITFIYAIIFVSGLVGNFCTCYVIVRNRYMYTTTNYYLFNLAMADILTILLGLPNDLVLYWQQYPYLFNQSLCKARAMISEMTSYASVLTIVFFTAERYTVICADPFRHPLRSRPLTDLRRVVRTIAATWLVALVSAIPFAYFTQLHYVEYPPGTGNHAALSAVCAIIDGGSRRYVPLFQCSFIVFFVVPLLLISVLYVRIGLQLRRTKMGRHISSTSSMTEADRARSSSSGIINILTAVVVTFFVCYAPFHAQRLLAVYIPINEWSNSMRQINETMYHVAGCCYYINCTTNPLLYSVMSKKYRKAFERTLRCSIRNSPPGGVVNGVRRSLFRRTPPASHLNSAAVRRRPA